MAGRTSTSVGMGVAITLLSVLSLALFICAVIFYGKYNKQKGEYDSLVNDSNQFVRTDERQNDVIRALTEEAKKSNKSLVGFLNDSLGGTMQAVSGSRRMTAAAFTERASKIPGADTRPLFGVIEDRDATIANLTRSLAEAEKARKDALDDRRAEVERMRDMTDRQKKSIDALTAEVDKYKQEVEEYRQGTNKVRAEMDEKIAKITADAQTREAELEGKIRKLEDEVIVQTGIISELRGKTQASLAKGTSEEALSDGKVLGANQGGNSVIISIGAKQKVRLGMTFAVYTDAKTIRPDPITGEYPRGKATLEVINVGDTSSTCRITSETRGNPVVTGDVIANPVFDPNKVYKMMLFGNFDVNGDGVATPIERDDLKALIESWGGKVVDELGGDTDFLVLGEKPTLPPRPPADAPVAVNLEYVRLVRISDQYDQLYQTARTTGLPLLNQNRLFTLIGRAR